MVFTLTPDQYALYEQAESRVRARHNRRVPRERVLAELAGSMLDQGDARARAKHQVVIHTSDTSTEAWYETDRGNLPVDSKILERAKQKAKIEISARECAGGVNFPGEQESPVKR